VDTSDNVDPDPPSKRFGVDDPPETAFTTPLKNEGVMPGVVVLVGSATDDLGVAGVEIAVKDRVSNLWWDPTTTTWGRWVSMQATLDLPGATLTPWSAPFDETAAAAAGGSGEYWSSARAKDSAGSDDPTLAATWFSIEVTHGTPPTYQGDLAGPALADLTPVDVASDATHYYAIDVARYRIVKINRATGSIDAQVGGVRSLGPGGIGAARAITIDSSGNIYVADTPNSWIQKFDNDLDFAGYWGKKGTGVEQFTQVYGLAVGTGRNELGELAEILYSVDGDGRIKKWHLDGRFIGDFSVGIALNQPRQVEIHPVTNDVWLVNARDREIVVVDIDGVERFRFGSSGTGPGQFSGDPRGIAISADGSLVFVSDDGNHRIQVFDEAGNYLTEYGGRDAADLDYLVDARGIDVTTDGMLIVTDEWDFSLKEFTTAGAYARDFFGTPPALDGVNSPRGLSIDSLGRVYVSDWWNQRIDRWDPGGLNPFVWGFRGTVSEPGSINFAWDVAVQPGTDRVFLANRESHEIEVFESDGTYVTRWGTRGAGFGQFEFPQGADFAPDGTLVVTDSGNGRVQRFSIDGDGNGTAVAMYGVPGSSAGEFDTPAGIGVAADGTIWVADTGNDRIQSRDPATGFWSPFAQATGGSLFSAPWGVTVAPDGNIWIADSGKDRIVEMLPDGTLILSASGSAMGAGDLASPSAIGFGLDGTIYVSDTWNNRIIELQE
jgi:DNA-binding beta-propeller fold protein YncE